MVAHDAAQMEVLRGIKDQESRSYFITADRALIRAVAETSSRYVLPHVLLPQQVAFLAQMANRKTGGLQAFSRTLWTVGESVAGKVKRYYTDRVLREYEEGLVAEIDTILGVLRKDLQSEGISLDDEDVRDPRSETTRMKLFERLDRFEPRFFPTHGRSQRAGEAARMSRIHGKSPRKPRTSHNNFWQPTRWPWSSVGSFRPPSTGSVRMRLDHYDLSESDAGGPSSPPPRPAVHPLGTSGSISRPATPLRASWEEFFWGVLVQIGLSE